MGVGRRVVSAPSSYCKEEGGRGLNLRYRSCLRSPAFPQSRAVLPRLLCAYVCFSFLLCLHAALPGTPCDDDVFVGGRITGPRRQRPPRKRVARGATHRPNAVMSYYVRTFSGAALTHNTPRPHTHIPHTTPFGVAFVQSHRGWDAPLPFRHRFTQENMRRGCQHTKVRNPQNVVCVRPIPWSFFGLDRDHWCLVLKTKDTVARFGAHRGRERAVDGFTLSTEDLMGYVGRPANPQEQTRRTEA